MPYVSCPGCGLSTYTPGTPYGRDRCPSCDAELPRAERRSPPAWSAPAERPPADEDLIRRVLELARTELRMDAAFLGEIRGEQEVLREVVGRAAEFGMAPGDTLPLEDTICGALLAGRAPEVLPDVSQHDGSRKLGVPQLAGVKAYVGVPLTGADARLYMLCCLARESRPALGSRDVQVLRGLAETMRTALAG